MRHCLLLFLGVLCAPTQAEETAKPVRITIETTHPIASFDPRRALGAGLDGHWQGDELKMLSPASVRQMLQAGLGPISVRLRTELAVEAWHWNPNGHWSDPTRRQGYWTSEAEPRPGHPILLSYGYKLPRRGDTIDEANDDGFSRLDDGDDSTFWKSNPYFTQPFTGEPDSEHPQWIVLDFAQPVAINAVRIHWTEPYATQFAIEYASGGSIYIGGHPRETWKRFPHGGITGSQGGAPLLQVADRPITAQYLRIWMTEGSGTAPAGADDARDRLGYAIREIDAGERNALGVFHDHVIHTPGKKQTLIYVSSTDPWHRASDRDPKVEQPGVDLIYRSPITRGLPVMQSVPVLYDTVENGAALAAYLKRSGYTVGRFELGEEPDGQLASPRDFAAVYARTAYAVRQIVPDAIIGGPSFVTGGPDYFAINYRHWLREFRSELASRGQSGDFQFLSFEWYPFSDGGAGEEAQIPENAKLLDQALTRFRAERLPIIIGEFNYSAYSTEFEVDLGGGLLNADTAAKFLCSGGETAYYYGYEPSKIDEKDKSWGSQLMLLQSKGSRPAVPVATFHTMRMVATDWLDPKGGPHEAFGVKTNLRGYQRELFSTYAVKRPDGVWSLLLINKDSIHPVALSVEGVNAATPFPLITYSSAEYHWHADGANSHPTRNAAPTRRTVRIEDPITIPPWSISVLQILKR